MDSSSAKSITSSEKETTPKRLAFSVENILDPNKFNGKLHQNNNNSSINNNNTCSQNSNSNNHSVNSNNKFWSGFDRDDKLEDDQSDSRSGRFFKLIDYITCQTAAKRTFLRCISSKHQKANRFSPANIQMRSNYTHLTNSFNCSFCHRFRIKSYRSMAS